MADTKMENNESNTKEKVLEETKSVILDKNNLKHQQFVLSQLESLMESLYNNRTYKKDYPTGHGWTEWINVVSREVSGHIDESIISLVISSLRVYFSFQSFTTKYGKDISYFSFNRYLDEFKNQIEIIRFNIQSSDIQSFKINSSHIQKAINGIFDHINNEWHEFYDNAFSFHSDYFLSSFFLMNFKNEFTIKIIENPDPDFLWLLLKEAEKLDLEWRFIFEEISKKDTDSSFFLKILKSLINMYVNIDSKKIQVINELLENNDFFNLNIQSIEKLQIKPLEDNPSFLKNTETYIFSIITPTEIDSILRNYEKYQSDLAIDWNKALGIIYNKEYEISRKIVTGVKMLYDLFVGYHVKNVEQIIDHFRKFQLFQKFEEQGFSISIFEYTLSREIRIPTSDITYEEEVKFEKIFEQNYEDDEDEVIYENINEPCVVNHGENYEKRENYGFYEKKENLIEDGVKIHKLLRSENFILDLANDSNFLINTIMKEDNTTIEFQENASLFISLFQILLDELSLLEVSYNINDFINLIKVIHDIDWMEKDKVRTMCRVLLSKSQKVWINFDKIFDDVFSFIFHKNNEISNKLSENKKTTVNPIDNIHQNIFKQRYDYYSKKMELILAERNKKDYRKFIASQKEKKDERTQGSDDSNKLVKNKKTLKNPNPESKLSNENNTITPNSSDANSSEVNSKDTNSCDANSRDANSRDANSRESKSSLPKTNEFNKNQLDFLKKKLKKIPPFIHYALSTPMEQISADLSNMFLNFAKYGKSSRRIEFINSFLNNRSNPLETKRRSPTKKRPSIDCEDKEIDKSVEKSPLISTDEEDQQKIKFEDLFNPHDLTSVTDIFKKEPNFFENSYKKPRPVDLTGSELENFNKNTDNFMKNLLLNENLTNKDCQEEFGMDLKELHENISKKIQKFNQFLVLIPRFLVHEFKNYENGRYAEQSFRKCYYDGLNNRIDVQNIVKEESITSNSTIARKLGRELAILEGIRKKRKNRGILNLKKILRKSIVTDGYPFKQYFKSKRIVKPKLVLLCDISGSMSYYVNFFISFFYEFNQIYNKIRTFLFVSKPIEVTDYFRNPTKNVSTIYKYLLSLPFINNHGYSRYNECINTFCEKNLNSLDSRTVFIVIGDARNNFENPDIKDFMRITKRVNKTIWINPEPKEKWNSGDSSIRQYGKACDYVVNISEANELSKLLDTHPFEINRID